MISILCKKARYRAWEYRTMPRDAPRQLWNTIVLPVRFATFVHHLLMADSKLLIIHCCIWLMRLPHSIADMINEESIAFNMSINNWIRILHTSASGVQGGIYLSSRGRNEDPSQKTKAAFFPLARLVQFAYYFESVNVFMCKWLFFSWIYSSY